MKPDTLVRIVSYTLGSTFLIMGIIFLTGWLIPAYIPDNFRYMIGAITSLWGIYRIASTKFRTQRLELDSHEELD